MSHILLPSENANCLLRLLHIFKLTSDCFYLTWMKTLWNHNQTTSKGAGWWGSILFAKVHKQMRWQMYFAMKLNKCNRMISRQHFRNEEYCQSSPWDPNWPHPGDQEFPKTYKGKSFKNLLLWNHEDHSLYIKHVAMSSGPLHKCCQSSSWGLNWPRPQGSSFHWLIMRKSLKNFYS